LAVAGCVLLRQVALLSQWLHMRCGWRNL